MEKYGVLLFDDIVLFNEGHIQLNANKYFNLELKQRIEESHGYAIAVTLKENINKPFYNENDIYHVGNLVKIKNVMEKNGEYILDIETMKRVNLEDFQVFGNIYLASYNNLDDMVDIDHKAEKEMINYVMKMVEEMGEMIPGSKHYIEQLRQIESMNELIAALMPYIYISIEEKQNLLEMTSLRKKCLRFLDIVIERKEELKLRVELESKISNTKNQEYRKQLLREQLRNIQSELNENNDGNNEYRQKVLDLKLPEETEKIILEEVDKLERINNDSAEANVIRSYLDLFVSLPWHTEKIKDIDIQDAEKVLDSQHYGLEKVKERIIQHLAVMKLKKNKQGSIVLLVGPPGTGKTSLARSVSEALDREYVRISLGGVRDEAEIRGHRKTYIGAMPGRIIQGMKRAGTKNPIFVLDEIDKLMASVSGDPSAALLEVLDPEQNNTFNDHYLNVPYDLSDVFFIATANDTRGIPAPLLDRMEVIQIGSYTAVEKYHIASEHLFNKSLDEHGLHDGDIVVSEDAYKSIIDKYTREAGVRGLKKQLDKLVRVTSEKIVSKKVEKPCQIDETMLKDILGHEINRYDKITEKNEPGIVTGMAWTPVGGDILFIEAAFIPGNGKLVITGQLGDVMKESVRISLSLIKSRLHTYMPPENFDKLDLHVHVPAGAIPKDGPSAGVTMLTAIASMITQKSVDSMLAMTGEISLRGKVLPVGGIKEKVIAAHRSGIRKILLPFDNKNDAEDIPMEVKTDLEIVYIKTIDELLNEALGIELRDSFYLNGFKSETGVSDDKSNEI